MILQQTNTLSDAMFSTEKGLQQNDFMNCNGTWNLCEMKKIADTSEWDKHYSNGIPLNDSLSTPSFLHTIRKKGEELSNESVGISEVSKVSPSSSSSSSLFSEDEKRVSVSTMKEMMFRMAVMQPIQIDPETVKPPKRRNVKISKDPQSVAARHRRERISEKIRILQRLVPGGTKMDTASMLDEAIQYMKFLKTQVQIERMSINKHSINPNFTVNFRIRVAGLWNINQDLGFIMFSCDLM